MEQGGFEKEVTPEQGLNEDSVSFRCLPMKRRMVSEGIRQKQPPSQVRMHVFVSLCSADSLLLCGQLTAGQWQKCSFMFKSLMIATV